MYINEYWNNFGSIDLKWHYFLAFVYGIIGLFGFIANSLVFYYLLKVKTVKRPGTYFLINLALADLGKIVSCIPMNAVSSFYGKWMFEQIGCNIYGTLSGLFGFVSISTMVFMSIERYLMIKNPLLALKLTNKAVFNCILITWIYSTIWIVPQLALKNGFVVEGFLTSCTFDYLSRDVLNRIMIMIMFTGGFFIPLMAISNFYILLFCFLKTNSIYLNNQTNKKCTYKCPKDLSMYYSSKNKNNLNKNKPSLSSFRNNSTKIPNYNNESNSIKLNDSTIFNKASLNYNSFMKREIKVAKAVILIIFMFCLAWSPYAIISLFAQYLKPENLTTYITPFTTSLPAIFAKTSSIYNPILYTLSNKECKAYLQKLFFGNMKKLKKDSDISSLRAVFSENKVNTTLKPTHV